MSPTIEEYDREADTIDYLTEKKKKEVQNIIKSKEHLRKIKVMKYEKGFFKPKVYDTQLEMYKELWEDSMVMCDRLSKQNEQLMLRICDLMNKINYKKRSRE